MLNMVYDYKSTRMKEKKMRYSTNFEVLKLLIEMILLSTLLSFLYCIGRVMYLKLLDMLIDALLYTVYYTEIVNVNLNNFISGSPYILVVGNRIVSIIMSLIVIIASYSVLILPLKISIFVLPLVDVSFKKTKWVEFFFSGLLFVALIHASYLNIHNVIKDTSLNEELLTLEQLGLYMNVHIDVFIGWIAYIIKRSGILRTIKKYVNRNLSFKANYVLDN